MENIQKAWQIRGLSCWVSLQPVYGQEPGSEEEIKTLCQHLGVTFPMFSKID
ncbi:hypothetical protein CJD41_11190 [Salmonella enterica subsp. enterica serovar Pullorum]|nr:hypothetical protein CJD41_11190 [Salmonella enterica subsp. enterica serovar Pullorum]